MSTMQKGPLVADPALLSLAFSLVFGQGSSRASGPEPDASELSRRIHDQIQNVSDAACEDAIARVQKLASDTYRLCDAVRDGTYGSGGEARDAVIRVLAGDNYGFSEAEYRQAFSAGMLWTAF
jgi:hypothetical protein